MTFARRVSNALLAAVAIPACTLLTSAAASATAVATLGPPTHLRVESLEQPAGIEARQPRFSWFDRVADRAARGREQTGYQIRVTTTVVKPAGNTRVLVWDSGKVPSPQAFAVPYGGSAPAPATVYRWRVRVWDNRGVPSPWSAAQTWSTGLRERDWHGVWIAAAPPSAAAAGAPAALPLFRREFVLARTAQRALLYVCGLGQYEVHVNGVVPTRAVLTPGWTNYRKRVLYDSYDVTPYLRRGHNVLGVLLGNGMYNIPRTPRRYQKFHGSFGPPKLIAELRVTYAGGGAQTIVSDTRWTTRDGPIRFSAAYGGEDYDARDDRAGWDRIAFTGSGWHHAFAVSGPGGRLTSDALPAITAAQQFTPIRVMHPQSGIAVYDLGQNIAGWPEIGVRGPAGSRITLVAGELLDARGGVTQQSANVKPGAPNVFTYTLKGRGIEYWHPRFSYWGFRYVEVRREAAASRLPVITALTGRFVHAAVERTGTFASSSALLDRIHHAIVMAMLGNIESIVTDCPHREKLGWLEQTYLAGPSLMDDSGLAGIYAKMADDIADAQRPDGLVPSIAPEYVAFTNADGSSTPFRDSPEWGSAAILSAWTAYGMYGDIRILSNHYAVMRRYARYLARRERAGLLDYGLGDWNDLRPGGNDAKPWTTTRLTASAIYYADLTALAKIAALIGYGSDASEYREHAAALRRTFIGALFDARTARFDLGSQTAQAMPLALGLVPAARRADVLRELVAAIRSAGNHVTAGDIGFHFVVTALMEGGRSDVLDEMLRRTDNPSYGYQLRTGATTLTESWDANPLESQNHFMLGHIEDWFYRGLGEIDVDLTRPRDRRITIAPVFAPSISHVSVRFVSVAGEIRSAWRRFGSRYVADITVPAGARARLVLPCRVPGRIRESGRGLAAAPGIRRVARYGTRTALDVGSGSYRFTFIADRR